jgi:hypothetical protein
MRLWRHMIQNIIGDAVLIVAGSCAAIGFTLLVSDILIDLTGNH